METIIINYQYSEVGTIDFAMYNNEFIIVVSIEDMTEAYFLDLNTEITFSSYIQADYIYISGCELNILAYTQDTEKAGYQEKLDINKTINETKFKELYEVHKDSLKTLVIEEREDPEIPAILQQQDIEKLEGDNRALTLRVKELKKQIEDNKKVNEETTLELLELMMGLI